VAQTTGQREYEVHLALATAFAGRPTEAVYVLIAKPELANRIEAGNMRAVSILVRGASDEWYERACRDVFEPRLHAGDETGWLRIWIQRDAIAALCHAAPGRGIEPLRRMLHLCHDGRMARAMLSSAQHCFAGADPEVNRPPLFELARNGDVQAQRIAAVCLGRMMMGAEDTETITLLKELCNTLSHEQVQPGLLGSHSF